MVLTFYESSTKTVDTLGRIALKSWKFGVAFGIEASSNQ